jgi:hypothetical protein
VAVRHTVSLVVLASCLGVGFLAGMKTETSARDNAALLRVSIWVLGFDQVIKISSFHCFPLLYFFKHDRLALHWTVLDRSSANHVFVVAKRFLARTCSCANLLNRITLD